MEGVAHSLRHLLDLYAELGVPAQEIALAGGGSATPGWPQIIADVCQRDVCRYAGEETVTRVLYALCQVYLGRGAFQENLLRTFGVDAPYDTLVIHPCRELAGRYGEGYRRYRAFARFAAEQAGVTDSGEESCNDRQG
jgi:sugar (pentulose or hexulose) kinase